MNRFNDLYKSLKEFVEPLYTKEREGALRWGGSFTEMVARLGWISANQQRKGGRRQVEESAKVRR